MRIFANYTQITIIEATRQAEWARQSERKEAVVWHTHVMSENFSPFPPLQSPQGSFLGPLSWLQLELQGKTIQACACYPVRIDKGPKGMP